MSRARNTYRRRCNTSLDQENEDIERLFDFHGAQESQGAVFANESIDNEYLHEEENNDPDKEFDSLRRLDGRRSSAVRAFRRNR